MTDSVLNTVNQNTVGSIVAKDWNELRMMSKDFFLTAPTLNLEQLENAHKCLALAYLSFDFPDTVIGDMQRNVEGPIIMRLATQAYIKRVVELEDA